MKTTTYLFLSLTALITGLSLMIFQEANYFSIGLLAMGVIGSMSCSFLLFLSKDTSSLESDSKNNNKNSEQKSTKNDTRWLRNSDCF